MGTRSTTTVYDGETPILTFYRQYDGYPSGHGQEVAAFLSGKEVVNGISGDGTGIFNGPGDLAVRLLTALKGDANDAGALYAIPHDQAGEEDYHYDVVVTSAEGFGMDARGSVVVKVKSYGTPIAEGSVDEFVAKAEAREMEDA
jgi:hypothetical protein